MLLVLVVGGVLGWKARRASIQRRAVEVVKAAGGTVLYDYQAPPDQGFQMAAAPWAPRWLRQFLGDELFQEVATVWLEDPKGVPPKVTSEALDALTRFDHLRWLSIIYVPMNDAEVTKLTKLSSLRDLTLLDVAITEKALAPFRNLTNLKHLSLRFKPNKLPGSSLRSISGMNLLEKLEILGLEPVESRDWEAITGLKNLKLLRLDLSPEGGDWAESIRGLENLTILDFRETRATDADLEILGTLPKLTAVLLDGSEVTDVGMAHLGRITSLANLHLTTPDRPSRITDAGLIPLANLKKLEGLWFSADNLTAVGFGRLAELPIKYLFLDGLSSRQKDLVAVAMDWPLQSLGLEGTGVTDDWLDLLSNQAKLSNLDLSKTSLTDDGMAKLASVIPRVSYLSLDGTGLTDVGLMKLSAAPALRSVSALGTKVTEGGIAALKAIRRSMNIEIGPIVPVPRHRSKAGN